MKTGTINCAYKGQAMTEFVFMAFVAFIVLFVAIQMAALGREAMALGQLGYQAARWATNPANNGLKDSSGNAVVSPQCTDVANLISGASVSPYVAVSANSPLATGYMGKIGYGTGRTVCGSPPTGGIGVTMGCLQANSTATTPCAAQRGPGVAVQVTLTMDTRSILFLNLDHSGSNPNFLGIPFPKTLSSTQTMLTQ